MTFTEVLVGLAVALAAGLLVGLEREQAAGARGSVTFGGVRTFPLIALVGALAGLSAHAFGGWIVSVSLLAAGALMVVHERRESDEVAGAGMVSEVAGMATFLLGALTLAPGVPLRHSDRLLVVIAGAGCVMALLAAKAVLHRIVARITQDDVYATTKFVVLTAVVLPLLPNRVYGPFDVLNPFQIGLMVVLVAGIGFVGYVAVRVLGPDRGLAATGLIGGLVSSTAVAAGLSRTARESVTTRSAAVVAIVAASSMMFARVLVEVAVVDVRLLSVLIWPLGAMTMTGFAAAGVLFRRSRGPAADRGALTIVNPFRISLALQFGAFYAAVIFMAKVAEHYFGRRGLYLSSVLAGTTDVDAITLSVATFHRQGLDSVTAATAITIAATVNTLVKIGIVAWLGGRQAARPVMAGLGAAVLAGAATVLALSLR